MFASSRPPISGGGGSNLPSGPKPLPGMSICFFITLASADQATRIQNIALTLGAKVTRDISRTTTNYVVTDCVGTPLYRDAMTLQLPIVQARWIEQCFTKKTLIVNWEQFRVQIFQGLRFCSTQIPMNQLEPLLTSIQEQGGTYNGQLNKDETTHLIAEVCSGPKYTAAKQWKTIRIVTIKWLEDCLKEKSKLNILYFALLKPHSLYVGWIPEDDYQPNPTVPSSSNGVNANQAQSGRSISRTPSLSVITSEAFTAAGFIPLDSTINGMNSNKRPRSTVPPTTTHAAATTNKRKTPSFWSSSGFEHIPVISGSVSLDFDKYLVEAVSPDLYPSYSLIEKEKMDIIQGKVFFIYGLPQQVSDFCFR